MITKNGKNVLLSCANSQGCNVVLTTGSSRSVTNDVGKKVFVYAGTENFEINKMIMRLGSGTTKETENDYCLQSPVGWNDCKPLSHTITQTISESKDGEIRFHGTFINNTSNAVTVSEIGLLFSLDSHSDVKFLVYRETFTPITIAPSETRAFTVIFS